MHWPLMLHMKIRPGPTTRSSGTRQRSAAAQEKRNKRKAERGWGPLAGSSAEEAAPGRYSGSREWNRSSGRPSGYGDNWWAGGSEWWGGSRRWQSWERR